MFSCGFPSSVAVSSLHGTKTDPAAYDNPVQPYHGRVGRCLFQGRLTLRILQYCTGFYSITLDFTALHWIFQGA